MANSGVVLNGYENADKLPSPSATQCQTTSVTQPPTESTSIAQETGPSHLPLIREQLHASGLSQAASDIILCAWRDGTKKQYRTYLSKWENYCNSKGISPVSATVAQTINFLAELVKSGVGYSGVNTARSAISTVLVISDSATFGTHPLVKRFLKGVFEQKPSLPRYETIWDVNQVLTHLRSYPSVEDISLKKLTFKVVMLLALLTGQRTQTLHCLDVNHMDMSDKKCIFYLTSLQKHSRPGKHQKPLELEAFDHEPNLCVIRHLKAYVDKTSVHRGDTKRNQLLLSFQKPFKPVSKDTISRWIKNVLKDVGIDTTKFGAHSTRAASTSAAAKAGTPLEVILESAGWSNCGTFAKFYQKPINAPCNFGSVLLKANTVCQAYLLLSLFMNTGL